MRPASFDEELSIEWSVCVLDHGLPDLPAAVERGESVPVARWSGPRFGAVLHLQWIWGDDADDDYLATEIELFRRTGRLWEPASGSGGSDWPLEFPLARVELPPGEAHLGGELTVGGDGWSVVAYDGVAGTDAAVVEVVDSDGITRRSIDSPLGIVLAAMDATQPATARVLTADGTVLAMRKHTPWDDL